MVYSEQMSGHGTEGGREGGRKGEESEHKGNEENSNKVGERTEGM